MSTLTKQCEYCNKSFDIPPRNPNKRFCSYSCSNKLSPRRKKNSGNNQRCIVCQKIFYKNPAQKAKSCSWKCHLVHRKRNQIQKPCLYCKKEMRLNPSSQKKFCSNKCVFTYKTQERIIRQCSCCKSAFEILATSDQKFCSHACYHKCEIKPYIPRIEKICPICNKVFLTLRNKIYCSRKCFRNQERNPKIMFYGHDWKEIRQTVLKRDNYKCHICQTSSNLHVHHVKRMGNFESQKDAHNLENLISLCARHHRKVECGKIKLSIIT